MKRIDGRTATIHRRELKEDSGRAPEEIRLNRALLRKGEFVNVRKWYLPPEGGEEFRPTRYGVAFPVANTVDLLAAIELVVPEAIERWLAGDFEGFDVVRDQREWQSARERRALSRREKRAAREAKKLEEQLEDLGRTIQGRTH